MPRRKDLIQPHGHIAGSLDRHNPRAPAGRIHRPSGGELEPRGRGCDDPAPDPDSSSPIASFRRLVDSRLESGNQQGKTGQRV